MQKMRVTVQYVLDFIIAMKILEFLQKQFITMPMTFHNGQMVTLQSLKELI